MLDRMKRGYSVADFRKIVHHLRTHMPDIAISTDIIVGFPDETEAEFQATLDLVREVEFDFAFMFAYSEREGTYASKKIPDTIPEPVKKARLRQLIDLQEEIGLRKYQRLIGNTVQVLAEGPAKRGDGWYGKSADFKTTIFTPHTT